MKITLIVTALVVFGLTLSAVAQETTWPKWKATFEHLARSKGLGSANECTPYQIGGEQHPHRLLEFYRQGLSPQRAFDEIGCDCEVFETVWLKQVRQLIQKQGRDIPIDDEAMNEWLWLEYFLEGKSPADASCVIVADDPYKRSRTIKLK